MAVVRTMSPPGPVRVLQVVGNAIVGGVETWVSRLLPALRKLDFDVACVFPFESALTDTLRASGIEVHVTPMPEHPDWDSVLFMRALVRDLDVQVMHAHMVNAHALASLVGATSGVPTLATIHGRAVTLMDLEAYHLGHSELTVVCQDARLQALRLCVAESHVHLVPNGIDRDAFDASAKGFSLHAHLGIAPGTRLVGFVGRLDIEKNPEMFIRIADRVRRVHGEVAFVLIGDGPLRASLQDLATELRAGRNIHFAGCLPDMRDVYAALDLLVMTSTTEGMPLALIEAMAAGVPAVATHVGGIAGILRAGASGILVHPGDVEYASQAVSSLLGDEARRRAMGAHGRDCVTAQLPWSRTTTDIARCLRRLATDGRIAQPHAGRGRRNAGAAAAGQVRQP